MSESASYLPGFATTVSALNLQKPLKIYLGVSSLRGEDCWEQGLQLVKPLPLELLARAQFEALPQVDVN